MFTHQVVSPHPDMPRTTLPKSLSNIILYLGIGTHGTTQHYIVSKPSPLCVLLFSPPRLGFDAMR
jgi:hypothetical protein